MHEISISFFFLSITPSLYFPPLSVQSSFPLCKPLLLSSIAAKSFLLLLNPAFIKNKERQGNEESRNPKGMRWTSSRCFSESPMTSSSYPFNRHWAVGPNKPNIWRFHWSKLHFSTVIWKRVVTLEKILQECFHWRTHLLQKKKTMADGFQSKGNTLTTQDLLAAMDECLGIKEFCFLLYNFQFAVNQPMFLQLSQQRSQEISTTESWSFCFCFFESGKDKTLTGKDKLQMSLFCYSISFPTCISTTLFQISLLNTR